MMFSMWLTENVQVGRVQRLSEGEKALLSKCALCGEQATGRRNEHLLFHCTEGRVVELSKEVEKAVEKTVSRLVKPGPVREAIMVPPRLDSSGRPPNVEVVEEVEAALGVTIGAETPVEGYRRLVSRQDTGGQVHQGQVHNVEAAGGSMQGEGVEAEESGAEGEGSEEECWVDQSRWRRADNGSKGRQLLSEEQEEQEAVLEGAIEQRMKQPIGKPRRLQEKTGAEESYEKRQMLWKGMSGKCWSTLVQQWGVPEVESLQLQICRRP